jgi:ABC-type antimicrobial peptide transport system permease subunit
MTKSQDESSSANYKLPMISIVLGFFSGLLGFLTGIPSIIAGHMALRKYKENFYPSVAYKRMAIYGLCLGYTGTLLSIYVLIKLKKIFF